jgi:serine/threonine protein kinase
VGEGAYADVFKGENIKSKELVAIKKMKHMKKAVLLGLFRMHRWQRRR